jgi:D-alanyl-D-alanine carboxypeptidase
MRFRIFLTALAIMVIVVSVSCTTEESEPVSVTAHRMTPELIEELDLFIDSTMQADNLPSVVIGIWIPDEGNYLRAFGTANIDTGEERLFDAPFRIASITKTFTATVILTLVDDGMISTSDPLSLYLPDFPNADNITIRNLLRMRSGLFDYADSTLLYDWYHNPFKYYPMDSLIGVIASHSDEFIEPGSITVYCNANYTLLARVAEIVSGKPFGDLVAERVTRPLGMTSTNYPDPEDYVLTGNNRGYSWDLYTESFVDKTDMNTTCANAGGAIISCMHDLEVYARALYQGTILTPETQQHRLETEVFEGAPDFMQYGEGILRYGEFYGHNGTIFGFSTEIFYLPAEDAVIVINVSRLDIDDISQSGIIFGRVSKLVFPEYVSW